MVKFKTLFKQDLMSLITSPGTVAMMLLFPACVAALMGFLFENLYDSSLVNSYDFYGVTMVIFVAMMASTIPANSFLSKNIKNVNTRIFYSPVARILVYSSKILACFLFMGVCISFNIIFFEVTSFANFGGENIGYILLLMMNFTLFLTMLSSAICVTLHSEELTNITLTNTTSVLGFLSGIFFPIANMGALFEKIAAFSPITWTVNCVFQLIYDGTSAYYWWIMLGLIVISFLLVLIVHRNYRPEDYI